MQAPDAETAIRRVLVGLPTGAVDSGKPENESSDSRCAASVLAPCVPGKPDREALLNGSGPFHPVFNFEQTSPAALGQCPVLPQGAGS